MKQNSRRTAAFIIARWLLTKEFPSNLLPRDGDRAFVQDLVYTTIRRLRALRFILGDYVKTWPKGELEALLYVGAAQILYMPSVPDFAAINETVKAAKFCSNPSIVRVTNGVLRNIQRNRAAIEAKLASALPETRESFPSALARRFIARYGKESAARLMEEFNKPAHTYIVRRPQSPDENVFEEVPRGMRVEEIEGYAEGAFIVQDPATAGAVGLMRIEKGDKVLDACAAPGGKTIQLFWRDAAVTACEVNPARRSRLIANLVRVGAGDVQVVPALEGLGGYDKVLVDAPCSNTGVLRRRPDARWNWSVDKLAALVKLQATILDRAAALVVPGGRLVYSTCSLEPEENEEQVAAFLARHSDFSKVEEYASNPLETGYDGAYAATLVRAK